MCCEINLSMLFCFSKVLVMCRISVTGTFIYKSFMSSVISLLTLLTFSFVRSLEIFNEVRTKSKCTGVIVSFVIVWKFSYFVCWGLNIINHLSNGDVMFMDFQLSI